MRALLALMLGLTAAPAAAGPTLFAAASTARAMDAALAACDCGAVGVYASSGALARQIEAGAPADVFLSANPRWMDHVAQAGLTASAPAPLLSNALVIIAPADAPDLALTPEALADRLTGERFAMADPTHAPVGRYGAAALETLGLWAEVAPRLAPMKDTRVAVATVARGEAPLALVYASDAAGAAGVRVAAALPAEAHPAILYPVALVKDGPDPVGAVALRAFLFSDAAGAIFRAHGFALAGGPE